MNQEHIQTLWKEQEDQFRKKLFKSKLIELGDKEKPDLLDILKLLILFSQLLMEFIKALRTVKKDTNTSDKADSIL